MRSALVSFNSGHSIPSRPLNLLLLFSFFFLLSSSICRWTQCLLVATIPLYSNKLLKPLLHFKSSTSGSVFIGALLHGNGTLWDPALTSFRAPKDLLPSELNRIGSRHTSSYKIVSLHGRVCGEISVVFQIAVTATVTWLVCCNRENPKKFSKIGNCCGWFSDFLHWPMMTFRTQL